MTLLKAVADALRTVIGWIGLAWKELSKIDVLSGFDEFAIASMAVIGIFVILRLRK